MYCQYFKLLLVFSFTFLGVESKLDNRIVSDNFAVQNQFPFMVSIRSTIIINGKTYYSKCGGSLLSDRFIVSAAHCFIDKSRVDKLTPANTIKVAAGGLRDLNGPAENNPNKQIRDIEAYELNPGYIVFKNSTHIKTENAFDVAVLKTKTPFNLSTNAVQTIPLAPKSYTPLGDGTVIGFGTVDPYNTVREHRMKYTDTTIIPTHECLLHQPWMHSTNTICARKFKKGFCAGDSGGPLVVKNGNGVMLVGIVSYNPGFSRINTIIRDFCALTLDMYASVPALRDFITDTMAKL